MHKDTLVHTLQYLDFLQNHIQTLQRRLPPQCFPQPCEREWSGCESNKNTQSELLLEPHTPPCSLKANRKHMCGCSHTSDTELCADGQEKRWRLYKAEPGGSDVLIEDNGESLPMWSGRCDWSEPPPVVGQGAWPVQDCDSLPSSPLLTLKLCDDGQEKRWRLYKAEPGGSDVFIEDNGESLPMWSGRCDWSEPQPVVGQGVWPVQDCDSLPNSPFNPSQLFTLSAHPGELCADGQEKRWRLYKAEPGGSDVFIEDNGESLSMWSGRCDWSEPPPVVGQAAWPVQDCDSLPSSPLLTLKLCDDGQEKRWRLYKAEPGGSDVLIEENGESLPMWSGRCDWSEPQPVVDQGAWPVQDCDSLPSSPFNPSQLFTPSAHPGEASGEQCPVSPSDEGHCSYCEGQMGSEESSPSSWILDSSPNGSWALSRRDRMLDSPVAVGSPPRQASLLPLLSVGGTGESLNLSPSLLTSPAHGLGLSHCILPEGQELQVLFEDVWVTTKSSTPNVSSLPCTSTADQVSEWEGPVGNRGGLVLSESEGEDCTWSPTQRDHNWCRGRTTARAPKPLPRSHLKKKCVNGFLMFCRINRKIYMQAYPGTPSTKVTKELAKLWHAMPQKESRQQNRNVRSSVTDREEKEGVASPLHVLLAHRDQYTATRGQD
ncbi:hypothetical protein AAFF_G00312980 [Aldrovandia affinis]|uniref:HMG box domain-containing protein n=1 Tax=Aldrovandia affinis TaxID=143900 RepID=A0AAD7SQE0_9TELE|nr:hypothetical protein AAFF_G00312980 [Aldrovandia affinis]